MTDVITQKALEIPQDLRESYAYLKTGTMTTKANKLVHYWSDDRICGLIERIANLTAEVERLKEQHACYVSLQEPQHRQALEERDEARAENTRLKAPVSDERWEAAIREELESYPHDNPALQGVAISVVISKIVGRIASRAAIKEGQNDR